MTRWVTESDRGPIIRLMQAAQMGCSWYSYEGLDGPALVDEDAGDLGGYVLFTLTHPEAHIRQLVVHPDHQHQGLVARRLLVALTRVALAAGCQGIEGFSNTPEVTDMLERLGAILQPGTRVRWPLVPTAQEKARTWMAEVARV